MNSLYYLKEQMEKLVIFLTPLLPLANTHIIDFIIADQWNTHLPTRLRQDLMNLEYRKLNLIPAAKVFEHSNKTRPENLTSDTTLEEFLTRVRHFHADSLNLFTPLEKLQDNLVEDEFGRFVRMMREKKAHEVSRLCQVIASVCRDKGIHQVVDIGCGIGNLSAVLLIRYELRVMAVDASRSNVESTLKRSKKIEKACKGVKDSKHSKYNQKEETREIMEGKKLGGNEKKEKKHKEEEKTMSDKEAGELEVDEEKKEAAPMTNATANADRIQESDVFSNKDCFDLFCELEGNFIGVTKFITEDEDLPKLIASSTAHSGNALPYNPSDDLCVVGLHTCGNLTPTSLKIYASNPNAKFLCNVSCCYHLLDEEFTTDSFHVQKFLPNYDSDSQTERRRPVDERYDIPELDPFHQKCSNSSRIGFPLSSCLKDAKFFLGRNARDLASKAVHRLSVEDKNLKYLFWRALFEVIVSELCGSWPQNAIVGRIRQCSSFYDYCRRGLKNIGLETSIEEVVISEYLEKYKSKESQLIRFYFLKASLSPLIETLIHLDRLIFLVEQGFTNSHLVHIFDSAVSPRSTAIISIR